MNTTKLGEKNRKKSETLKNGKSQNVHDFDTKILLIS